MSEKKYYIFRNYTVEPFFRETSAVFSGYEDISGTDIIADEFIWFYLQPYSVNNKSITDKINLYEKMLQMVISKSDKSHRFFIFTMQSLYKIRYQTSVCAVENAIIRYNGTIYQLAANNSHVKVIDIRYFTRSYAEVDIIDWKYYLVSQMPMNPKLGSAFEAWFRKQLDYVDMKRKKCIVTDLDNTLWKGVIGEDGIEGIMIGGDYPGNVYKMFQEYLLELSNNGIMLAICSKNNEEDVLEVWEKHPENLIGKANIVACKINWENKVENIKQIASELNIGADSIVFIDDSPYEREMVRKMLPEVSVPEFPDQPFQIPSFIKSLTDSFFSAYKLLPDDYIKVQQYKENEQRKQFQSQFDDYESYLRSLETELTIEKLNDCNLPRLAQLTQKTNQFNLTSRRYSETDIRRIADEGGWVYGLKVKDRFGDNGLTGLIIITLDDKKAVIDTFLLSCRILGRQIEVAFLQYMLVKMKALGIRDIEASFIATSKNAQTSDFYSACGFEIKRQNQDIKIYGLDLMNVSYSISGNYSISEK
jgi:FkbH-like protein